MKIPFADLFSKKARLKAVAPPKIEAPMPIAKKSEGERLAKTVMPSSTRAFAPETEDESSTSTITSRSTSPESIPTEIAVAPNTAGGTPAGPTAGTAAPRKISMGATATVAAPNLPPAVAMALAPNIERAISLPLEDVIAQMPEGYLKPRASFDVKRPVLLRAAEVERGMATGQPAIPVATLFQQAPDIFMHTVPSSDGAMLALPFDRVMTALSNLVLRRDQTAVQAVPQVETPFLQVTKEDTERFGTPMPSDAAPAAFAAAKASAPADELPPVRIEAASAEAYAAATPEAADTFMPAVDPESARRIPFPVEPETGRAGDKFGTGEPAFPRVPASSGPPVPSAPPAMAAPARIPSKENAETLPPSLATARQGQAEKKNAEALKAETLKSEIEGVGPVLTLPLRSILQNLPPMQLGGNPASVPSDKTVSFPMGMIAPQLASGKVMLKPNAFYAALPEECRRLFLPDAVDAPVQLPLAEVLAHLPGEALRLREDQEEHRQDEVFETPFAAKAKEDAVRFAEVGGQRSEVGGRKSEDSTQKFDAKEAVAKACALGGVEACSVIFSDGLSIAGNVPESMHLEGLSAVAPTLLQKLGKHMLETSFGALRGMTVHAENSAISFFAAGDVCLTAVHTGEELATDSRCELIRITEEISRAYSQSKSQTGG